MLSRSGYGLLKPIVHKEKTLKGETSSPILLSRLDSSQTKKEKKDRLDESVKRAKRKNKLDNEPTKKEKKEDCKKRKIMFSISCFSEHC